MRGLVLAVAIALPGLAWAQTSSTGGTLVDEPAIAPNTTTATTTTANDAPGAERAPSLPAAETSQPAADTPAPPASGVAAPGISISNSDEAGPATSTPPRRSTANSSAATPGQTAPGVAAPGVHANGAQSASTAPRSTIEPANALERAFVAAARQENQRAAFRHTFLDAQVALATVSTGANAAPRLVRLGPAGEACLIFTSDARATQIMGARSPRQMMTGREALQRLRGAHLVIININLDPYLTLDAAGVDAFLGADAAPNAQPLSAGPAQ